MATFSGLRWQGLAGTKALRGLATPLGAPGRVVAQKEQCGGASVLRCVSLVKPGQFSVKEAPSRLLGRRMKCSKGRGALSPCPRVVLCHRKRRGQAHTWGLLALHSPLWTVASG